MSVERIKFTVPLDDDGYLDLQCPYCGGGFKLLFSDVEDESLFQVFCPYCGLIEEPNTFVMETDVGQHAMKLAENHAKEQINKMMKDFERSMSGNSFIKIKIEKHLEPEKPKTLIALNDLVGVHVVCCDKSVRVGSDTGEIFCPFCGVK